MTQIGNTHEIGRLPCVPVLIRGCYFGCCLGVMDVATRKFHGMISQYMLEILCYFQIYGPISNGVIAGEILPLEFESPLSHQNRQVLRDLPIFFVRTSGTAVDPPVGAARSRPNPRCTLAEPCRAACPHAALTGPHGPKAMVVPAVRSGRIFNAPLQRETPADSSVGADYISAQ